MDFGTLGNLIGQQAASMNQSGGIVVMAPAVSTFSYNMGLGMAAIQHNEILGNPMDFLWTVHTYDDGIHIVAS